MSRGNTLHFLPDTSVIIASVCSWHESHGQAHREIEKRLGRKEEMLLAGHAMIEAYSVLTRLPASRRLAPDDALAILDAGFASAGRVVALEPGNYLDLLRAAPSGGISGGIIYDALIAATADKAGANCLLTFNPDHFRSFGSARMSIVVPGESRASA